MFPIDPIIKQKMIDYLNSNKICEYNELLKIVIHEFENEKTDKRYKIIENMMELLQPHNTIIYLCDKIIGNVIYDITGSELNMFDAGFLSRFNKLKNEHEIYQGENGFMCKLGDKLFYMFDRAICQNIIIYEDLLDDKI
jgi:hypothetical protein